LVESRKEFIFTYSNKGEQLYKEGKAVFSIHKASGRNLPMLKDVNTGKTLEILKGVSNNAAKIAALSAIVVSAAHLISGADLAKKMESISEGVDFLVAGRRIDQLAELEAIYAHTKAVLSEPLTDASIGELRWECRELTKLRSIWRRELEYHLQRIADPGERAWLTRKLSRDLTQDRKIVKKLSPLECEISLVDFSFLLQLSISDAIGAGHHFIYDVLPEELRSLNRTAKILQEKVLYISGKNEDEQVSADGITERINVIVRRYGSFVPETETSIQSIELST